MSHKVNSRVQDDPSCYIRSDISNWTKCSFYSRRIFYFLIYLLHITIIDNGIRPGRLALTNTPLAIKMTKSALSWAPIITLLWYSDTLITWPAGGCCSKSSAALAFEEIPRRQSTASIPNHTEALIVTLYATAVTTFTLASQVSLSALNYSI